MIEAIIIGSLVTVLLFILVRVAMILSADYLCEHKENTKQG